MFRIMSMAGTITLCLCTWVVLGLLSTLPVMGLEYFGGKEWIKLDICVQHHIGFGLFPGWEYMVGCILAQDVFMIVAIYYFSIKALLSVMHSEKNIKKMGHVSGKRSGSMILKVFIVHVTCNAIPRVMLISFQILSLIGVPLSPVFIKWFTIIVLPSVSFINPYMLTVKNIINKRRSQSKPRST